MNAHVNSNCIGCGLCPNLCPAVFTMTEAGTAAAQGAVTPELEGQVREAADGCPVDAIELD